MRRWLVFAALVGGLVALSVVFSPDGSTSSVVVDPTTVATGTFFPTSRAQLTNLAPGEAEAIVSLGSTGAGIPTSDTDHAHTGVVADVPLSAVDTPIFASQWGIAQESISSHD